MSVTEEQILEVFAKIRVAAEASSGVSAGEITLESDIYADLDLDSTDFVEFVMDVEDAFDLRVPWANLPEEPTHWLGRTVAIDEREAEAAAHHADADRPLPMDWSAYREGANEDVRLLLAELGFSRYAVERLDQSRELASRYHMTPTSLGFIAFCVATMLQHRAGSSS